MEEVKRTNIIIVYLNQWTEFVFHNLYTIDINRENRKYYDCRGFGHLVRNCRNRRIRGRIRKGRRLEYERNKQRTKNNR